jgi:xanthine dehydrogenase molybdopterin-binding subunit B
VGFDDTAASPGLKLTMLANCGFSADLSGPVADRAVFHTDNAYYLERCGDHLATAARRTPRATPRFAASAGRRA